MTRRGSGQARAEVENDLRTLRTEAGLTQEEVARLVGVSRRTIGSIERGEYVPSVTLALRLVRVFGLPVGRMFWLAGPAVSDPEEASAARCPSDPPADTSIPQGSFQPSTLD